MLLGCRSQQGIPDFAYAAVTLFGRPFTGSFRYPFVFSPCRRVCRPLQNGPTTPNGQRRQAWHPSGLGSSRFARRYLGNRNCFLFLRVLRWFTSPGSLALSYVFRKGVTPDLGAGFPHSEIDGSRDVCSSPSLIAAYHVLLRLHAPRHPPCALCSLPKEFIHRQTSVTRHSRTNPSGSHRKPCPNLKHSNIQLSKSLARRLVPPGTFSATFADKTAVDSFSLSPLREGKTEVRRVRRKTRETSEPEDRGGGEGTRTPDPLLAKQVLCQLSYTPTNPRAPRASAAAPNLRGGPGKT